MCSTKMDSVISHEVRFVSMQQVAAMTAKAKQQRSVLDKRVIRIANYGIPV